MRSTIRTELPELALQLLAEEDAAALTLLVNQNRAFLRPWMPWLETAKRQADQIGFIRKCVAGAGAGEESHYAMRLCEKMVGIVSLNQIDRVNHCATMGYWLAQSQSGRGLMGIAVAALLAEGFNQLKLNRIQARVATDNYRSEAVCSRAGLRKEGVLRQAAWHYDHFIDLAIYSILRCEWEARSQSKTSAPRVNLLKD